MPFNGGKIGVLNQPASDAATGYYNIKDVDLYTRAAEFPGGGLEYDFLYDYTGGTGEIVDIAGVTVTEGSGITTATTSGIDGTTNSLTSGSTADTNEYLKFDFGWDDTTDILLFGMYLNGDGGASFGALVNSDDTYCGIFTSARPGLIYGTGTFRYNNDMDSKLTNQWGIYVWGGGYSIGTVNNGTGSGLRIFQANIGGGSSVGSEVLRTASSGGYTSAYKSAGGLIFCSGGAASGVAGYTSRTATGWTMKGVGLVKNFASSGFTYDDIVGDFQNRFFG